MPNTNISTTNARNEGWAKSMSSCRSEKSSYLMGDVSLSNAATACRKIHGNFNDQRWIGIFRVHYLGEDKGNLGIKNCSYLFENTIRWVTEATHPF